ncbi:MAG: hypothetical protein MJE77_03040 [Proteobacteria bacterium]|nr:hypothetical protein [Pseudomonadota bacterium]
MVRRTKFELPEELRPFFWDTDFDRLSWEENFGYIVRRLLSVGGSGVISWLRDAIGDVPIRDAIVGSKARGLTYHQVAQWIPRSLYESWIAEDPNPDEPEPNRPPGALPLDPAGDSSPDPSELRSE